MKIHNGCSPEVQRGRNFYLAYRGESVPGPKRTVLRNISSISIVICFLLLAPQIWAQGESSDIRELLRDEILSPVVAEFQYRQYIIQNTAPLPKAPATAEQWSTAAGRLRHQ